MPSSRSIFFCLKCCMEPFTWLAKFSLSGSNVMSVMLWRFLFTSALPRVHCVEPQFPYSLGDLKVACKLPDPYLYIFWLICYWLLFVFPFVRYLSEFFVFRWDFSHPRGVRFWKLFSWLARWWCLLLLVLVSVVALLFPLVRGSSSEYDFKFGS